MRFRCFGCGKFGWLASAAEDRPLTVDEREFMARHRSVCAECRRLEAETALALNMLRESRLETPDAGLGFNRRVMRRARISSIRAGLSYWSPAIYGASIAAVALIAALQLLSQPGRLPVFNQSGADARRIVVDSPIFPDLPIAHRIRSSE